MKSSKVRRMTIIAMMGALAFLLMFMHINIPFLSPFADFELSSIPEIIGGFILGPIGAILIIVVKLILKLAFMSTSSMFTGELQNLLLSMAYALPATIIYRKNKTKKGALQGILLGIVVCTITAIFTNLVIIFPFYIRLYGYSWDMIISVFKAANPLITNIPMMVLLSVIPCNIIYKGITSGITFVVYKKISVPLKKWLG